MIPYSQNLPAGLMDDQTEFFVSGMNVYALHNGTRMEIEQLPEKILDLIWNEIQKDPDALAALVSLRKVTRMDKIKMFVHCRFGGFNNEPDITKHGVTNHDYWDCPIRGMCKAEGKLCKPVQAPNGVITNRQIQVLKLIAKGLTDCRIGEELAIATKTVAAHRDELLRKLGVNSKSAIASWAVAHNLV